MKENILVFGSLLLLLSSVYCLPNYGNIDKDFESLMRGMSEIERRNGRIVFAKYEKTPTGSLETKVIVPDQSNMQLPAGMQQLGDPTYVDSGWQQQNKQWLPQEEGPEEEVILPDRQSIMT